MISLSLSLVVIIIISIVMVLFATQIGLVVFAQNRSNTNTNSILDEYTYVCIKFNETVGERGLPVYQNPDFLNTQEICNMLLQGMGSLDKQEILKKYE